MTRTALFILATAAGALVAFALIDAAHNREAYHDMLTRCYFDEGCTLSAREFDLFMDKQTRDILEGADGR